jgi:long-chain acyl-CoA synthetase
MQEELKQWSTVVPNTSTESRGDIRRNCDPLRNPELGFQGCQTLYEAFRRGQTLNPLGACLGFRAVSTNGMATPFIYSSYTEVQARVNAFAAGLDTLDLVRPTDENMTLVRSLSLSRSHCHAMICSHYFSYFVLLRTIDRLACT